jgi:transposase
MDKEVFIGVDFSKKTFDVSVISGGKMQLLGQKQFENNKEGCKSLLSWVRGTTSIPKSGWMFCGENTGLYSVTLSTYLIYKGLFIWIENPIQIKQCSGVRRGKSDPADSLMIAKYACRYRAVAAKMPDKTLHSLRLLLSYRQRLINSKKSLQVAAAEMRAVHKRDSAARFVYEDSVRSVEHINKQIKDCEKQMRELIKQDDALRENYEIVSSVKGIALVNTVAFLVATENFTRFQNSRQYACYAGLAPFGNQSGSSLDTSPHVSHFANKKIKVLLTQAAQSAIQHDPKIRSYFQRKIAEGKEKWVVINNVRNKMVHCVFALVKKKELYQPDYQYSLTTKNVAI